MPAAQRPRLKTSRRPLLFGATMAGIGETLREARVRAHLDIVDFEARTKIRAKYLRALEDEEWNQLPGYTFTKGFLRTYADMLGLDGRALVDEFKRQYRDPGDHDAPSSAPPRRPRDGRSRDRPPTAVPRQRPPRGSRRPLPIAIVVVVLALVAVGVLYAIGKLGQSTPTTTTRSTSTTHTTQTTHTGSASSHARTTPPPAPRRRRVGVRLIVTAPRLYVCLVGYPGTSNAHRQVRLDGVILTPSSREPTYHANHFRIVLGNNGVVLLVDGARHSVPPSATAIVELISLHGV